MEESETQRLQTLAAYDIWHSSQEQLFDDITALAAYLFETPVARIAFVAAHDVWHKASVGMPAQEQLPAAESLCTRVVAHDRSVMVLEELGEVPALMQQRQVHLYAAALLRTPQGQGIGTLCVAGPEPRIFTADELDVLHCLAELVVAALEKRRTVLAAAGPAAWERVQRQAAEALREQITLVRYLKARYAGVVPVPAEVLLLVCKRLDVVTRVLQ